MLTLQSSENVEEALDGILVAPLLDDNAGSFLWYKLPVKTVVATWLWVMALELFENYQQVQFVTMRY